MLLNDNACAHAAATGLLFCLAVGSSIWLGELPALAEPINHLTTGDAALDAQAPSTNVEAPAGISARSHVVDYRTKEGLGTIVIDTSHTSLYLVLSGGKAIRYSVGVGRDGFTWSGIETVVHKAEWPDWYPPAEMLARQPFLPRMMAGGLGNPLGARAIYLGNTAYRIHGTKSAANNWQAYVERLHSDVE